MVAAFKFPRALLGAVLLLLALVAGYALPYPERWDEQLVGKQRADAWRLLGVPDIEYGEKFDGWNRNAIFGAWVLTIRFGEDEKISSVEKKFSWGFGYLWWDDDYRAVWKEGLPNQ
jgi:hypothetical protein